MKSENFDQDVLLKKLASKAKRKLNRTEDEVFKEQKKGVYEFVSSERNIERKKLEKKVAQLLKNNPDCDNPIGKLIDMAVYKSLSEEQKQSYILKLSEAYAEISEKFRVK